MARFPPPVIMVPMLVTTARTGLRLSRPKTFAGLMNLYESNFVRMSRLLDMHAIPDEATSNLPAEPVLEFRMLERAKFTSIANLTYRFCDDDVVSTNPDLVLRIYHDANLVEAESCADLPRHPALKMHRVDAATELERRWQRNILLHKWLEFCLESGHRFTK